MPDKDFTYNFKIDVDQSGAKTATGTLTQLSQATDKAAQATTKAAKAAQQYTVCQREYVAMSRKAAQLQKEIASKQQELDKTLQLQAMAQQDRDKAAMESSNTATAAMLANADKQIAAASNAQKAFAQQAKGLTRVGQQAMSVAGQFTQANSLAGTVTASLGNVASGLVTGGAVGAGGALLMQGAAWLGREAQKGEERDQNNYDRILGNADKRSRDKEASNDQLYEQRRQKRIEGMASLTTDEFDANHERFSDLSEDARKALKANDRDIKEAAAILADAAAEKIAQLDLTRSRGDLSDTEYTKRRITIEQELEAGLHDVALKRLQTEREIIESLQKGKKEEIAQMRANGNLFKDFDASKMLELLNNKDIAAQDVAASTAKQERARQNLKNYIHSDEGLESAEELGQKLISKELTSGAEGKAYFSKILREKVRDWEWGKEAKIGIMDGITGGLTYMEKRSNELIDAVNERERAEAKQKEVNAKQKEYFDQVRKYLVSIGRNEEAITLNDEDLVTYVRQLKEEAEKEATRAKNDTKDAAKYDEMLDDNRAESNSLTRTFNRKKSISAITRTQDVESAQRSDADKRAKERAAQDRAIDQLTKQAENYYQSHKDGENGGFTETQLSAFYEALRNIEQTGKISAAKDATILNILNKINDGLKGTNKELNQQLQQLNMYNKQLNRK
jgi:hypothetical protein